MNTGFLFDEQIKLLEEEREGGGEVRVVVSGPWDGEMEIWSPLVGELKLTPKLPGMLKTGGKLFSLTSEESGTLTVLTVGAPCKSVPG